MTEQEKKQFDDWQIGIGQQSWAMFINETLPVRYAYVLDAAIKKYGIMTICRQDVPLTVHGWLNVERI